MRKQKEPEDIPDNLNDIPDQIVATDGIYRTIREEYGVHFEPLLSRETFIEAYKEYIAEKGGEG